MRVTNNGRPYCTVRDPLTGAELKIHPEVFSVLEAVISQAMTGSIELNFTEGNYRNSNVRTSGTEFSRVAKQRATITSPVIQAQVASIPR